MTAIVLHLYYQDLWEEFKEKIIPILDEKTHLYITVNYESEYTEDMQTIAKQIFVIENKGMDFGPFVYVWDKIKDIGYKYVLKLHGKKSESVGIKHFGTNWRFKLINPIIKNKEKFEQIISFMEDNPIIYMAGSQHYFYDTDREKIDNICRKNCLHNIKKLLNFVNSNEHGCFFAGSIFLVTSEYLTKFFNECDLNKLYLEFEDYYSDDSDLLAHAMERVIGYGVEKHKGKFLTLEKE